MGWRVIMRAGSTFSGQAGCRLRSLRGTRAAMRATSAGQEP